MFTKSQEIIGMHSANARAVQGVQAASLLAAFRFVGLIYYNFWQLSVAFNCSSCCLTQILLLAAADISKQLFVQPTRCNLGWWAEYGGQMAAQAGVKLKTLLGTLRSVFDCHFGPLFCLCFSIGCGSCCCFLFVCALLLPLAFNWAKAENFE